MKIILSLLLLTSSPAFARWSSMPTNIVEAIMENNIHIAKKMLEEGMDVNMQNEQGDTALIIAVAKNRLDMTKLLVENGADVNLQTNSDSTALILASLVGRLDIVKFLVESGADVNLKDMGGNTALDYAKELEGYIVYHNVLGIEISDYLRSKGAKSGQEVN